MNDSEGIRALRRELGRALKEARGAAGYSQAQLARKTGYARSTVSTVESGSQNVPRIFWERSDAALGAGAALIARYDRLAQGRVARFPHAAAGTGGHEDGEAGRGLNAGVAAEAAVAYRRQGWQVEHTGGRIELVCGDGVEALEVPRPAGVVAVHWWLHTGGAPDEIRGLPALPGPQDALAVVAAGDRFLFLVQPGACPWVGPDLAVRDPGRGRAGGAGALARRRQQDPGPAVAGSPRPAGDVGAPAAGPGTARRPDRPARSAGQGRGAGRAPAPFADLSRRHLRGTGGNRSRHA